MLLSGCVIFMTSETTSSERERQRQRETVTETERQTDRKTDRQRRGVIELERSGGGGGRGVRLAKCVNSIMNDDVRNYPHAHQKHCDPLMPAKRPTNIVSV